MTTVSAVIPTYNRSEELERAIQSVLSQSYGALECLIIDDGSTDQTAETVKSFNDDRIVYLKHETNRGVSAARNTGINASVGEYIAFLDSDDEWGPEKIEKQVKELQSRSKAWNSIYCGVNKRRNNRVKQLFDKVFPEAIGEEGGEELIKSVISAELAFHAGSTLLAERESVLAIGGFDESLYRHEELEFLVRLLEDGKMAYLDEKLVTLYDSGYPNADLVMQEKRKFLQSVDQYLENVQLNGSRLTAVHEVDLAKAYCREGRWGEAYHHLKEGRIESLRHIAGLIWAITIGIKRQTKSAKN